MSGLNKVQLIGRLGKDPETKHLDGGRSVSNFSIATSETWKDKVTGEKKEATEWHNIVVWGALAGVAEKYLKKGSQIYVEGKLRTRSWEKDGVTRYTTEVFADTFLMLGGAAQSQGGGRQQAPPSTSTPADNSGSDDLPF